MTSPLPGAERKKILERFRTTDSAHKCFLIRQDEIKMVPKIFSGIVWIFGMAHIIPYFLYDSYYSSFNMPYTIPFLICLILYPFDEPFTMPIFDMPHTIIF